jgi:hypothetical protein
MSPSYHQELACISRVVRSSKPERIKDLRSTSAYLSKNFLWQKQNYGRVLAVEREREKYTLFAHLEIQGQLSLYTYIRSMLLGDRALQG